MIRPSITARLVGHAVEALMHTAQNDVEEEHLPEVKRIFHPK
jgi:hypothetical protein